MTTKEAIQRLLDTLDERAAVEVLDFVQALTRDEKSATGEQTSQPINPRPLEWMSIAKPTPGEDLLAGLVGSINDNNDGPTDVARNHDRYLAEAYEDWRRR